MAKNYRTQVGSIKAAALWKEPKNENGKGYYSIGITRSEKRQDGSGWDDKTIYLFPNEMLALVAMLEQLKRVVLQPEPFEIKQKSDDGYTQPNTTNDVTEIGDDIPF